MSHRLTVSEIERRIREKKIGEIVANHVAGARATGVSEAEIARYVREAQVQTASELEQLMPVMLAWLFGGTAVAAPKRMQ